MGVCVSLRSSGFARGSCLPRSWRAWLYEPEPGPSGRHRCGLRRRGTVGRDGWRATGQPFDGRARALSGLPFPQGRQRRQCRCAGPSRRAGRLDIRVRRCPSDPPAVDPITTAVSRPSRRPADVLHLRRHFTSRWGASVLRVLCVRCLPCPHRSVENPGKCGAPGL